MSKGMQVLAVNVGSSSLKLERWEQARSQALTKLEVRGIGTEQSAVAVNDAVVERQAITDHETALELLLQRVPDADKIMRIGHRVVHGGAKYRNATWLSNQVIRDLDELVPLSPLHQPPALSVIDICRRRYPDMAQAAVFDTAFHASLPPRAFTYAVPESWRDAGVRRYGFHGIACADVVAQLGAALRSRAIILHLGAGCSATAVREGKSIDTTMGFTPLEGLVMGSRGGDIDPGALLYVQREMGLSPQQMDHLLNERSGLLALSGFSADMSELLQSRDERAAAAVELFCYRAAKAVGALAVALDGLDQLIFSGGIGEHAVPVRADIGALVSSLGVGIDDGANRTGAPVISSASSAVEVRVMAVDEGRQIARETMLLKQ